MIQVQMDLGSFTRSAQSLDQPQKTVSRDVKEANCSFGDTNDELGISALEQKMSLGWQPILLVHWYFCSDGDAGPRPKKDIWNADLPMTPKPGGAGLRRLLCP